MSRIVGSLFELFGHASGILFPDPITTFDVVILNTGTQFDLCFNQRKMKLPERKPRNFWTLWGMWVFPRGLTDRRRRYGFVSTIGTSFPRGIG